MAKSDSTIYSRSTGNITILRCKVYSTRRSFIVHSSGNGGVVAVSSQYLSLVTYTAWWQKWDCLSLHKPKNSIWADDLSPLFALRKLAQKRFQTTRGRSIHRLPKVRWGIVGKSSAAIGWFQTELSLWNFVIVHIAVFMGSLSFIYIRYLYLDRQFWLSFSRWNWTIFPKRETGTKSISHWLNRLIFTNFQIWQTFGHVLGYSNTLT